MRIVMPAANFAAKEWIVEDDKLYIGKKVYPLEKIISIELKKSLIDYQIVMHTNDGKMEIEAVCEKKKGATKVNYKEALELMAYVKEHSAIAEIVEMLNKETIKKCNVCGKVFTFTERDLIHNSQNAKDALSDVKLSTANVLFGSKVMAASMKASAERKLDSIVDYSRCPSCGSTDLVEITAEEAKQLASGNTVANAGISGADEILKYKNLLDAGIITQEEFEQKKKQLLGL